MSRFGVFEILIIALRISRGSIFLGQQTTRTGAIYVKHHGRFKKRMRSVLVTGGAGYIGSHTTKALAQVGLRPIIFDNLSTGHSWLAKWGKLIEGDVRDASALSEVFRMHGVWAVVHLAGSAYVCESITEPAKYYDNNVTGSLTLLNAMKCAGVKHIVFSSSCSVYGDGSADRLDEKTPFCPLNPYAETKASIEKMLWWYAEAYGISSVSLRYFNAAGADSACDIGEVHLPETHLIPLAIEAALGQRTEVRVCGSDYPTNDGSAVRDYTHVTDLARGHIAALDYLKHGGETVSLNLGTGIGHSVLEVISTVEKVSGHSVRVRKTERRPGDPAVLVANPELARRLLGWRARYTNLTDIIRTAWDWHTNPDQRRPAKFMLGADEQMPTSHQNDAPKALVL